ncbi:ATP-grasp domain-containing protein [Aureivirga sp. CE67]|uniref:ATP-grasp domain-containing protein n=1 Tax=Aureivirga sp. CE67 TaxID=1788983 RepID=UPI0018C98E2E|nr:ATP-grasp domain-containing protein [Aureivirga sp. CE67]
MKVYIQTNENGTFYNINDYTAYVGFDALGYEIEKYVDADSVKDLDRESIFVGGIGSIRKRLKNLGLEIPEEFEYPEELSQFLGRKIWKSTLEEVMNENKFPVFVKPLQTKLFTGKVFSGFKDFIGLKYDNEVPVWCSEIINFETEWRCYIRYGEILDVRYYKGKWDNKIDLKMVADAVSAFKNQPNSFSLDVGIDASGNCYLVEINDGHSLGTYGIGPITYAKFLSARWSQLTGTKDYLRF